MVVKLLKFPENCQISRERETNWHSPFLLTAPSGKCYSVIPTGTCSACPSDSATPVYIGSNLSTHRVPQPTRCRYCFFSPCRWIYEKAVDTVGCMGKTQESQIRKLGFLSLFLKEQVGRRCVRKQILLLPLLMEQFIISNGS